MIRRPPISTLFPFATLFRSAVAADPAFAVGGGGGDGEGAAGGGAEPEAAGTVVVGVAGEAAESKRQRRGPRLDASHGYASYGVLCFADEVLRDLAVAVAAAL